MNCVKIILQQFRTGGRRSDSAPRFQSCTRGAFTEQHAGLLQSEDSMSSEKSEVFICLCGCVFTLIITNLFRTLCGSQNNLNRGHRSQVMLNSSQHFSFHEAQHFHHKLCGYFGGFSLRCCWTGLKACFSYFVHSKYRWRQTHLVSKGQVRTWVMLQLQEE